MGTQATKEFIRVKRVHHSEEGTQTHGKEELGADRPTLSVDISPANQVHLSMRTCVSSSRKGDQKIDSDSHTDNCGASGLAF